MESMSKIKEECLIDRPKNHTAIHIMKDNIDTLKTLAFFSSLYAVPYIHFGI